MHHVFGEYLVGHVDEDRDLLVVKCPVRIQIQHVLHEVFDRGAADVSSLNPDGRQTRNLDDGVFGEVAGGRGRVVEAEQEIPQKGFSVSPLNRSSHTLLGVPHPSATTSALTSIR